MSSRWPDNVNIPKSKKNLKSTQGATFAQETRSRMGSKLVVASATNSSTQATSDKQNQVLQMIKL